ncbi:MAG: SDR family NAD(P)-dependent oxidoreductase, partial [Usitatibacteraceae bacterium]
MTQSILITGASSGFGLLTTHQLIAQGHRVVATMRDPQGRNASHAKALTDAGANVVAMDVTQDDSVSQAVDAVLDHFNGRLEVVVNNAGLGVVGLQECFTVDDWKRVFDVNVFGVARVNRAVLPT